MTKQLDEKSNYDFCLATIEADKHTEEAVLALAERYYKIHALKMYEPAWSSFEEYCMEIKGREYSTVMKLIGIHEKFVVQYRISPKSLSEAGGWSVISELLPVIKTKDDANKWLQRAKELPREHLRAEVREHKRGIPIASCKHTDTYLIRVCRGCGEKHEVHE